MLLALSASALGAALAVNFGQYHPAAVSWLLVGLLAVIGAIVLPNACSIPRLADATLAAGALFQLAYLWRKNPCATISSGAWEAARPWLLGAACSVALGLLRPRRRWLAVAGLAASFAGLGLVVLHAAPQPGVDVCLFQRESATALLEGRNPYSITFADPYAGGSSFYGPGLSVNGRLQFGYPYPPLPLLMILPAHLLGDFRYAQWAALVIAGVLIECAEGKSRDREGAVCLTTKCPLPYGRGSFSRQNRTNFGLGAPAACLLLFSPSTFFVLEAGWIEPLAAMFLAAAVFFAARADTARPARYGLVVSLGLLLASKQYMVLLLPLVGLLPADSRRERAKLLVGSVAVAAAASLPLALWNLPAFLHSAVFLQFGQPFRPDSLSFAAAIFAQTGRQAPSWLAFAAAGGMIWLCRRALRPSAGAFALAAGATLLVFFAFNKQAFCNYYHLVLGCLCCAAAASDQSAADSRSTR